MDDVKPIPIPIPPRSVREAEMCADRHICEVAGLRQGHEKTPEQKRHRARMRMTYIENGFVPQWMKDGL